MTNRFGTVDVVLGQPENSIANLNCLAAIRIRCSIRILGSLPPLDRSQHVHLYARVAPAGTAQCGL